MSHATRQGELFAAPPAPQAPGLMTDADWEAHSRLRLAEFFALMRAATPDAPPWPHAQQLIRATMAHNLTTHLPAAEQPGVQAAWAAECERLGYSTAVMPGNLRRPIATAG